MSWSRTARRSVSRSPRGPQPRRRLLVALQPPVQLPNLAADALKGGALLVVKAHELGEDTLGVDPAQGMAQQSKLAGVVADNGQIGIYAMRQDGRQQGAFSDDADMTFVGDLPLSQSPLAKKTRRQTPGLCPSLLP